MRTRTAIILTAIALAVLAAGWYYLLAPPCALQPACVPPPAAAASGTLAFPGLAEKLGSAARVAITSKGQTLLIAKAGDASGGVWGLTEHGGYRVPPDKLRELLTGLTELRLTEARTSDPAQLERLGLGDPASPASTSILVQVLDGQGQALAGLIVGHRRVRSKGSLPDGAYVRRPGENQAWLAEGQLPVDTDPLLWLDRNIANIDSKKVASVVVHRGDAVLEFGRDGEKPVLKMPAEHPRLDDYRVEDLFRSLENLTLTDVKPAAQQPGERIGTAALTLTDASVVDVTVFGVTKADAKEPGAADIWAQFAVRGESEEAKKLAARVNGWTYQIEPWKEKAFVPALADLKAEEKAPPPAAPAAPAPAEAAPAAPAATVPEVPAPPPASDEKKPE
jgi:hypothetical protein